MSEGKGQAEARQSGLAQAFSEQFSLRQALGGPREMIEAVIPMTLFSVVYGLGGVTRTALVAAVVPTVGFVLWRLTTRQPLTHAISGLIGIAIGALLAVRTGRPENLFLPSVLKNSVQAVIFGVSALSPWPLLGVFIGFLRGEGLSWRNRPDRLRAYRWATGVWAGMFVVRLVVQVPLFLAGEAAVLGLANVVLGLPLFAAALWLVWVIVRDHHSERAQGSEDPEREAGVYETGAVRPDALPG